MPFISTEPQRIAGTKLGFAVYPYRYSYDDHIDFSRGKFDRKLYIVKLKDTRFNEVAEVLQEDRYVFAEVDKNYVNGILQEFVDLHPQYVTDSTKMQRFFESGVNYFNCRVNSSESSIEKGRG